MSAHHDFGSQAVLDEVIVRRLANMMEVAAEVIETYAHDGLRKDLEEVVEIVRKLAKDMGLEKQLDEELYFREGVTR